MKNVFALKTTTSTKSSLAFFLKYGPVPELTVSQILNALARRSYFTHCRIFSMPAHTARDIWLALNFAEISIYFDIKIFIIIFFK